MGVPPHKDVLGPALSFPKVVGFRKSTTVVGAVKLNLLKSIFCTECMSTRTVKLNLSLNFRTFCRGCVHGELGRSADDVAPASAGREGGRVGELVDVDDRIDGQLIEPGGALSSQLVSNVGFPGQFGLWAAMEVGK